MILYLASRSPRRRELLDQIKQPYDCLDIDINEDWDGEETAADYVARLALEKARAGYRQVGSDPAHFVLGADTSVVLDDQILGKAETEQQAMQMLQTLSGRMHTVYTGVALVGKTANVRINCNRVSFRPLTVEECLHYCRSGEPIGKAGGYAVQGEAAKFIERIEGSYSGVMGLPLYETAELIRLAKLPDE